MVQRNKGLNISIRHLKPIKGGALDGSNPQTYNGPIVPSELEFDANSIFSATGGRCRLWLRSDEVVLSGNGVEVESWINKATSSLASFLQPTPANKPGYITGTVYNGEAALRFDGIDQYLISSASVNYLTNSTGITVIAFGEMLDNGGAEQVIIEHGINNLATEAAQSQDGFYLGLNTGSVPQNTAVLGFSVSGAAEQWAHLGTGSYGSQIYPNRSDKAVALFGKINMANINFDLQLTGNNVSIPLGLLDTAGTTNNTFDNLFSFIGARSGSTKFFSGSLMEIMVYDHILSGSEIEEIYTYLSGRYYPASASVQEFSPLEVSSASGKGCYAWYVPTGNKLTISGSDGVYELRSNGTPAPMFRQSAPDAMPKYIAQGACNNQPALHFSGARGMNTLTNWTFGGRQATVFIVAEPHSSSRGRGITSTILEPISGAGVSKGISAYTDTIFSNAEHQSWGLGEGVNAQVALLSSALYQTAFSNVSCSIMCATFDRNLGARAQISASINFSVHPIVTQLSQANSTPATGDFDAYQSTLGYSASGSANGYFSGSIYEIIIYDHVLSASQIATVKNYLSGKYCPTIETFLPTNVSSSLGGGLQFWIRADQVVMTGSSIGSINDLSSGAVDLTQSNAQYQSLQKIGNLKNRPAIYFDRIGNSGSWGTKTTHTKFTGKTNLEIFAVIEGNSTSYVGTVFNDLVEHSVNFNANPGFCLGLGTGNGTPPPRTVFWGHGNGTTGATFATGSIAAGDAPPTTPTSGVILIAKVIGKASPITSLNLSGNNNPITLKQGDDQSSATAYGTHKTYIGSRAGSTSKFSGSIYEVLIFDHPLSASEEQRVWTYLSGRYFP